MGQAESAPGEAPTPRPRSTLKMKMEYGMYVMPMDVFLAMEQVEPHQTLKAEGKLIEWTPDLDRPVFFLSHQWLAFNHPDPLMEQVKTCQALMRNLVTGEMDVPLGLLHKCGFDSVPTLPGSHWKEVIPNAVIWMDYFSMPQPRVEGVEMVGSHTVVRGAMGSDKRGLSTDLNKAVRSIPVYVENSEYFFVLAPPAVHKDKVDILDRESWASRGWCRMEAQARALSTNAGPLILVQGEKNAEMMIPAEWYRLPVGEGEFTMPEDKHKVAAVLGVMFDNRMRSLETSGNLLEWRFLRARKQALFAGLPHPYAKSGPMTLSEFYEEYRFSGANDEAESGWTPLRFAILAKDIAVVKALLAAGADVDAQLADDAHSLYHQAGQTLCHTAAQWADLPVISALVEAGADLEPRLGA